MFTSLMMYTLAVCFTVYLHVSGRTHIMTALCVCVCLSACPQDNSQTR